MGPQVLPLNQLAVIFHQSLQVTNNLDEMKNLYTSLLGHLGEDPKRQGLLKTPERAAKAMLYFTKGYEENMDGELKAGGFEVRFSL